MTSATAPLRFGAIDFDRTQIPFFLCLAERLAGIAEFHFFQRKADTQYLFDAPTPAVLWRGGPPRQGVEELSDAQLLEACGAHEAMWCTGVPQLLARARPLATELCAFLQQGIDCLIIFNGAPLARSLAAYLGARMGIPCVYIENGYLPGSMQLDPAGVNYASSHTGAVARGDYRSFRPQPELLERALDWLRSGRRPADVIVPSIPRLPVAVRLRRESRRLLSPKAWRWLDLPVRNRLHEQLPVDVGAFVLLPLQVRRDSQLSLYSPLIGDDLERLVLATYRAMRTALPDHRLVIKLHPKETQHVNRRYLHMAEKLPDAVFLYRQPMNRILPACDLVVTVNSTVGVEALAFGKPVVTLGRNFYTVRPLVHPVTDLDELPQAMTEAVQSAPDAELRLRFLGYVQQVIHVPGSFLDVSERSQDAVAARLLALAGMEKG